MVLPRNRRAATRLLLRAGLLLTVVLAAATPAAAGGAPESEPRTGPIAVYASVMPQADIMERIGREYVDVGVLIGPGQDAHTYDPSPREIERLAGAELLFTTGLEYEARIVGTLERSARGVRIVDLTEGIELRELEAHYHDPSVPHSHDNEPGDPHIWLGPDEVRRQAQTIRDAFIAARPEWEEEFRQGYERFLATVDEVERELAELLEPMGGKAILVYHPAFGYLTDHFGITQLAIEAGGREPSPRQLEKTIELALEAGVEVVFTQPEYDDVASRAVARAIGARTVPVTDLGDDWVELMREIGEALAGAR